MTSIFDNVTTPEDLKKLSPGELPILARELRDIIIRTATANGGHLASNLGVTELTIALHRVFNSPRDKIIWDVGHQCYVHKLVTGRKKNFETIRRYAGLSGFPDRDESVHDHFTTGHAGTSISSAVGMALARDINGEDFNVIAVIGDGSITAGMAFEAMNHAGHMGTPLTIVYNDNGMSISPTVGTFFHFFNRIRFDNRYERAKLKVKKKIAAFPGGRAVLVAADWFRGVFFRTIKPQNIWDGFGFTYIGPVDGHDIRELEAVFTRVRDFETKSTIVHVITKKGKGYEPAEENATEYHGVAPRSADNTCKQVQISYSDVFAAALMDIMSQNQRVVAITAAMLDGTGLAPVKERFPDRVFDVGICEQHAVTMAAGMAAQGLVPVLAIYSTFLQRAYDQIIHDVALQRLPVIFAIDRGGVVGSDGKTHQGLLDISFMRSVPYMVVTAPGNGTELRDLLYTAVNSGMAMSIRFPRGMTEAPVSGSPFRRIPLATGELLREGDDCLFIATGIMSAVALETAGLLDREGFSCAVLASPFIEPLDTRLIKSAALTARRIITLEENSIAGGFGSAIAEFLAHESLTTKPLLMIGTSDIFIEHGTQSEIRAKYGLDACAVASRARDFIVSAVIEPVQKEERVSA